MSQKTVLVVEDDQPIRNAIALILDRHGFRTIVATDGAMALLLVDQADVVLLDLLMPVMDGEAFLRRIREEGNYIPVIVMSAAYGRDESLQKMGELKIVEFLEKPFTATHLVEQVKKACAVTDSMKAVAEASGTLKKFLVRQEPHEKPPNG
jgi:CheY-like chemotaxis protein